MIEIGKIEDVFDVGSSKRVFKSEWTTEGVPFYRAREVVKLSKNGTVDNELFISEEMFEKYSSQYGAPKTGDILVTGVGTLGICYQVKNNDRFYFKDGNIIWLKNKGRVDSDYIEYCFKSPFVRRQIEATADAAVVGTYTITNARETKIPLPPLPQQKKIAAILDAADAYRQKTKALIDKYNELTQSLFLDMFGDPVANPKGWDEIKLGDVCGIGSSKRVFVNELVNEGVPFYRGTEVGKLGEGKKIEPSLFITKNHFENLKRERGIPKIGDLLLPSICPDGRIWIVDNDNEFYFKDGRVLWIEIDSSKMNSVYLRYHLKGSFFANYNNIASGTTFAELKIVALKKMNVFYPEMMLQNQFAESVQAIEAQKTQAEASLAKADNLFNSLLQRAFKGELV